MRLNHPDYIKLVIEAYNKKRSNNELSPLLAQSTPANLKKECLNVYRERHLTRDDRTLRTFFGPEEHGKKFLQLIQRFETDRFRPLDNYLKGSTEKTDDKNVELLAWLIDFNYRPFVIGMDVLLNEDERLALGEPVNNDGEIETPFSPEQTDAKDKDEIILNATIEDEGKSLPQDVVNEPVIIEENRELLLLSNSVHNPPKKIFKKGIIILVCLLVSFAGIYTIRNYESARKGSYGSMNTATVAQDDSATKQKTDSLIPDKNVTRDIPTNSIKKIIHLNPPALDSSHCLAITKKGTQCKRKAKANGYYCWQHGG